MLKRKATPYKSAPRTKSSSPVKAPKEKVAPVRRRFVVSSKAAKLDAGKEAGTPAPVSAKAPATKASSAKTPANGLPASPAPSGLVSSVDLTETIKTLLHLSQ